MEYGDLIAASNRAIALSSWPSFTSRFYLKKKKTLQLDKDIIQILKLTTHIKNIHIHLESTKILANFFTNTDENAQRTYAQRRNEDVTGLGRGQAVKGIFLNQARLFKMLARVAGSANHSDFQLL